MSPKCVASIFSPKRSWRCLPLNVDPGISASSMSENWEEHDMGHTHREAKKRGIKL
jgi:hypothetical protein